MKGYIERIEATKEQKEVASNNDFHDCGCIVVCDCDGICNEPKENKMKIGDADFSRNVVNVISVYLEMNGNDAELYLNDGTHFLTVELKVAQSVVDVIHSHNIETKDDLFKMDWNFCRNFTGIGNYVLYGDRTGC